MTLSAHISQLIRRVFEAELDRSRWWYVDRGPVGRCWGARDGPMAHSHTGTPRLERASDSHSDRGSRVSAMHHVHPDSSDEVRDLSSPSQRMGVPARHQRKRLLSAYMYS